jgi:SEFIR domain
MKLIDKFILEQLEMVVQQSRSALNFIGVVQRDGCMLQAHRDFVAKFEEKIFSYLEGRLRVIKNYLFDLRVDPNSVRFKSGLQVIQSKVAKSLEESFNDLTHTNLEPPLEIYHIAILTQVKEDLRRCFIDLDVDERGSFFSLLNKKILEQSLLSIKNVLGDSCAPTCFISYSWDNASYVSRIHEIAFALKAAGVNILLDIEQKRTGLFSTFIEYIDSDAIVGGRSKKADFILVMCTEDLKERWHNFVTKRQSWQVYDPAFEHRGHVLPVELKQISARIKKEPSSNQSVFPILLSGTNKTSLPSFLPKTTAELTQTDRTQYGRQLLKLLKTLYQGNGATYQANEAVLTEIARQEWHYLSARDYYSDLTFDDAKKKYEELCEINPTANSGAAQQHASTMSNLPVTQEANASSSSSAAGSHAPTGQTGRPNRGVSPAQGSRPTPSAAPQTTMSVLSGITVGDGSSFQVGNISTIGTQHIRTQYVGNHRKTADDDEQSTQSGNRCHP